MPTDIISLTEFKNDASGWLERLQHQPPVVLTQNGRGKAVVQSYESWQQQRFAIALLHRVIQGQADAAEGRTLPHDQVIAEAYALIDTVAAGKAASTPATAASGSVRGDAAPRGRKRA